MTALELFLSGVPDYTPTLPPGIAGPLSIGLGWLAGILIAVAVAFMIVAGIRVAKARREGMQSGDMMDTIGRPLIGLIIGLLAPGIVSAIVAGTI